jgi:hypothetical protein
MIWSVSTLLRRNGTARPECVTNDSMVRVISCQECGVTGRPAR